MYNSKNNQKVAAEQDTYAFAKSLDDAAHGGDLGKRIGVTNISTQAGLWDRSKKLWSEGVYPKASELTPGTFATPFAGLQEQLSSMPAVTKGGNQGERVIGGFKNADTGHSYAMRMFYQPDGDNHRLKVSVHLPESGVNAHGNHIYDVESGKWHLPGESHDSPEAISSYNPMEVMQSAPEDFANATQWTKFNTPSHSDGFCKSCKRFPRFLSRMLKIMRPENCTACGMRGGAPEYPWEPGTFVDLNSENGTGVQTSAFSQYMGPICRNKKCISYNKSIASEPAFVTPDYQVVYPGAVGAQGKKIYQLTPAKVSEFRDLRAERESKRTEISRRINDARLLGDLGENGDYHAARDEQSSNEYMISSLAEMLANHEIVDSYKPDHKHLEEPGQTTAPSRMVYDNPIIKEAVERGGAKAISLPAASLECDHEDCPDTVLDQTTGRINTSRPIRTHVDKFPKLGILPCQHCRRGAASGVKTVTTEDGYTRCDPSEYGANTCAPLPQRIADDRADDYFSWFDPDPVDKYPVIKKDAGTGMGVLFQRTEDEQDPNKPNGTYPGTQRIFMKNPSSGRDPVGNGYESPRDYFKFGKKSPWTRFGMFGRKIMDRLPLVDHESDEAKEYATKYNLADQVRTEMGSANLSEDDINRNANIEAASKINGKILSEHRSKAQGSLAEERITPEDFEELSSTPVIGSLDSISDTDPVLTTSINPFRLPEDIDERIKPQTAVDELGREVAPGEDLSQEDYDLARGYEARSIPTVSSIVSDLAQGTGTSHDPIRFREKRGSRRIVANASGFVYPKQVPMSLDSGVDWDDLYGARPDLVIPDTPDQEEVFQTQKAVTPGESLAIAQNEVTDCPECKTMSILNNVRGMVPQSAVYVSPHCPTSQCPGGEECHSDMTNRSPHCHGCKDPKICVGRKRKVWRNVDAVCSTCDNNGFVSPSKVADRVIPAIGEGAQRRDIGHEDIVGNPTNAMDVFNDRIGESALGDLESHGIETTGLSVDAINRAREIANWQRQKDREQGLIVHDFELENEASDLKKLGPAAYLQAVENGVYDADQPLIASLEQDVQDMVTEPPREGLTNLQFDSPAALERVRRLREDAPREKLVKRDEKDDSPYVSTTEVNNIPVARIEHDEKCTKCNRGIIIPEVVGPEEMRRINNVIGQATAQIRRTVPAEQQPAAINQMIADQMKCRG